MMRSRRLRRAKPRSLRFHPASTASSAGSCSAIMAFRSRSSVTQFSFPSSTRCCTAPRFSFPLRDGDGYQPLKNVRQMIDFFDARCPAGRNLLLSGRERDSVEADWTQFNATLGGATAAFAYFHFLPHRAIMIRPLSEGTPAYEVEAVRWAYPLFARFLRMALKLSASAARGALGQVRQVVQSVDARLADGRRYLVGDRFSLSDMALGINWATPCLARECGGALPGFGPT